VGRAVTSARFRRRHAGRRSRVIAPHSTRQPACRPPPADDFASAQAALTGSPPVPLGRHRFSRPHVSPAPTPRDVRGGRAHTFQHRNRTSGLAFSCFHCLGPSSSRLCSLWFVRCTPANSSCVRQFLCEARTVWTISSVGLILVPRSSRFVSFICLRLASSQGHRHK